MKRQDHGTSRDGYSLLEEWRGVGGLSSKAEWTGTSASDGSDISWGEFLGGGDGKSRVWYGRGLLLQRCIFGTSQRGVRDGGGGVTRSHM